MPFPCQRRVHVARAANAEFTAAATFILQDADSTPVAAGAEELDVRVAWRGNCYLCHIVGFARRRAGRVAEVTTTGR